MSAEELTSGYRATLTIYRPEGQITLPVSKDDGGGGLEPEDGRRRNATTGRQRSIGGKSTRSTKEVTIACDLAVWALKPQIDDSAGVDRYHYIKHAVDGRGRVVATVESIQGTLGQPTWPEFDLDGGDDESWLTIESGADE